MQICHQGILLCWKKAKRKIWRSANRAINNVYTSKKQERYTMFTRPKNTAFRWCTSRVKTWSFVFSLLASLLILTYIKFRINSLIKKSECFDYYNADVLDHVKNGSFLGENHEITNFPFVREYETNLKKYDNENARMVGFPLNRDEEGAEKNSSTRIIYLATPYFTEWNPKHYYFLHFGRKTFERYSCPIKDCFVTKDPSKITSSHAILFHVRDLQIFSFPRYRSPEQIWILYSMEPPWLEINDFKRFNGLFNWTMSYRRYSDIRIAYGFIGRRLQMQQSITNLKVLKQKMNKAVWYVSNCRSDSNREEYVRRLMKIYPVDIFGGCGREACRPAETKKCYVSIERNYKFYLSFENSICQDYVTEKLFNPLEYFIIPITLGGANYNDIVPVNSIINAMEFPSPEELGHFLWKVSTNETLYLSFFEWKKYYRSYLQPWMCHLCYKLHENFITKTVYDLESWWHGNGTCQRWVKGEFSKVEQYAIPQFNTKIFRRR